MKVSFPVPCYVSRGMAEFLKAVFVGLHALGPVTFPAQLFSESGSHMSYP